MDSAIYINEEYCESRVYHSFLNKRHQNVYLVKVSFLEVGCHINSITVQPSPKHPERGLWVQMPRFNAKGNWIWPLQIQRDSPLRRLIDQLALRAVDDYARDNGGTSYDSGEDLPKDPEAYSGDGLSDFTGEISSWS